MASFLSPRANAKRTPTGVLFALEGLSLLLHTREANASLNTNCCSITDSRTITMRQPEAPYSKRLTPRRFCAILNPKGGENMNFKFNITLTDKEYFDYNIFWSLKSPYGKKQIVMLRVVMAVLFCAAAFAFCAGGGFSTDSLIGAIPYLIVLVLFQLLLKPFFSWTLKGHIKSLKKKGKMGYSPVSKIEFYDEMFVETTPDNKTEQKYTAVERVSIIGDTVVYIHVNNVMAYILPRFCFESKEQYDSFLEFIKEKCVNVNIY